MVTRTSGLPRTPRATPRGGVCAIVLAAGTSSRMGEPKPLARVAGRPLLAHVLDALRESRVDEIVAVLGAESERIRRGVSLEGARVVVNPEYVEGMSASVRAGIRAAGPDAGAFLIVLGDQPLVKPSTYDAIVGRWARTGARVVVPVYRRVRGNPVLLHRSLAEEIEHVTGDVGCREIVAAHADEVVEVAVDDPGVLIDIDTPDDLRRLAAALERGTPLDSLVADRLRTATHGTRREPRGGAARVRVVRR